MFSNVRVGGREARGVRRTSVVLSTLPLIIVLFVFGPLYWFEGNPGLRCGRWRSLRSTPA
jgi:hypothetical protein